MFANMFSRISLRTKFIITAIIAFWLGTMLRGGSSVGRYQFHPTDPKFVIDTQTGDTYQYSSAERQFTRIGSLPWH